MISRLLPDRDGCADLGFRLHPSTFLLSKAIDPLVPLAESTKVIEDRARERRPQNGYHFGQDD